MNNLSKQIRVSHWKKPATTTEYTVYKGENGYIPSWRECRAAGRHLRQAGYPRNRDYVYYVQLAKISE